MMLYFNRESLKIGMNFQLICAGDGFHDNFEDAGISVAVHIFVMIYSNSSKKLATDIVSESESCLLNQDFFAQIETEDKNRFC